MVLKGPAYLGKLLVILLANTLCYATYNQLENKLALEIIGENHKNVVISPLMIRFPLCKLASVASGTARSDLISILGIKSDEVENCYTDFKEVLKGLAAIDFLNLNKIIVNYTDDVNTTFISNSANYGVRVDKVGFNYPNLAVSFVNRWVDKATFKRVTDVLVPGDINEKSSMLIVNAAYLKVTWEFPFHIKSTKDMKFHHHDGRVSVVPMMSKINSCLYLRDEISNTQYVTMKLASFGVTMTIMVPQNNKGLPELLRKLLHEPSFLIAVQKRMKYEMIKITLPKFKIKSNLDLNETLRKIGASTILNEKYSGLKAILKNNSKVQNIYVSKVKQKNFIDVDEMGTMRQLPRDMYDDIPGRSFSTNEVVFDHPFYFIVHLQTDLLSNKQLFNLFQGVYYGPE